MCNYMPAYCREWPLFLPCKLCLIGWFACIANGQRVCLKQRVTKRTNLMFLLSCCGLRTSKTDLRPFFFLEHAPKCKLHENYATTITMPSKTEWDLVDQVLAAGDSLSRTHAFLCRHSLHIVRMVADLRYYAFIVPWSIIYSKWNLVLSKQQINAFKFLFYSFKQNLWTNLSFSSIACMDQHIDQTW
jgi:hypothetical protein